MNKRQWISIAVAVACVVLIVITTKRYNRLNDGSSFNGSMGRQELQRLIYAAEQDSNPIVGLMHSTIALCKVQEADRTKTSDINARELRLRIRALQDKLMAQLARDYPSLALPDGTTVDPDLYAI